MSMEADIMREINFEDLIAEFAKKKAFKVLLITTMKSFKKQIFFFDNWWGPLTGGGPGHVRLLPTLKSGTASSSAFLLPKAAEFPRNIRWHRQEEEPFPSSSTHQKRKFAAKWRNSAKRRKFSQVSTN